MIRANLSCYHIALWGWVLKYCPVKKKKNFQSTTRKYKKTFTIKGSFFVWNYCQFTQFFYQNLSRNNCDITCKKICLRVSPLAWTCLTMCFLRQESLLFAKTAETKTLRDMVISKVLLRLVQTRLGNKLKPFPSFLYLLNVYKFKK